MNLRTLVVKGLYPMCSNEVQILLDQMQDKPEKFMEIFWDEYSGHPWARALGKGNFELIDHIALRQQLKLLKNKFAKQLILEGLLEIKEYAETEKNNSLFDSIRLTTTSSTSSTSSTPSKIHLTNLQLEAAKKQMLVEMRKQTLKEQVRHAELKTRVTK